MRHAHKIDTNQPAIVAAMRKVGAQVIHTSDSKMAGFDLLVAHRGRVFIVEVKDGAKPESARALTSRETATATALAAADVDYYVVQSADDALQMLGF